MKKYNIIVPKGIRYISDWKEYGLENYAFPHILNKTLTGCGFTEYCIRNNQDLILISPRKILLENKEDQHPGEVYYAKNKLDYFINFERDISNIEKKPILEEDKKEDINVLKESITEFKEKIKDYIRTCTISGKPFKILVTYDSFKYVKEILKEKGRLENTQIVIDEFQSIFTDARFKSDTEIGLLYQLQDLNRVCFASATPMLDKYLEKLDEFKDLPYYRLDWETEQPGRVKKPCLNIKFTYRTLNEEVGKVIQSYLNGKYEIKFIDPEKNFGVGEIVSNEAVFFMNSIQSICQAIRSNDLTIEQCNILCANTDENEKKLRSAFTASLRKRSGNETARLPRGIKVFGKIPKQGEPHKMFTFCTRTVYLGADFYSKCARTFVFSDANIECLSVDISMDLEQILGRQRLDENPWKNTATLFVKTTRENLKMSKEEFDNRLDQKISSTNSLLRSYSQTNQNDRTVLAKAYKKLAVSYKYRDDYVAVNEHDGVLYPVFNNLMLVSEQRAFDIQQIDYRDRFSVFSAIEGEEISINIKEEVKQCALKINETRGTGANLRLVVSFGELDNISESDMNNLFNLIPNKYGDYYRLLGPDKIKACEYREADIRREWNKKCSNSNLNEDICKEIYGMFEVGKRYLSKDIKSTLKELYSKLGYKKTAKATDILDYFEAKQILTPDKKHGYEIISKK